MDCIDISVYRPFFIVKSVTYIITESAPKEKMFLKKRCSFIKKSLAAARGEARGGGVGALPQAPHKKLF
jgi:hypothetical protein